MPGRCCNSSGSPPSPDDTFWVQSTTAPTTIAGLVTITDDLPVTNRWNLAAVEIQAVNS